jgi:hypothetical protein
VAIITIGIGPAWSWFGGLKAMGSEERPRVVAVGAAKDDASSLSQAVAGLGPPGPGQEFYPVSLGDDERALWGRPRCMA